MKQEYSDCQVVIQCSPNYSSVTSITVCIWGNGHWNACEGLIGISNNKATCPCGSFLGLISCKSNSATCNVYYVH